MWRTFEAEILKNVKNVRHCPPKYTVFKLKYAEANSVERGVGKMLDQYRKVKQLLGLRYCGWSLNRRCQG